eukprot:jgi/Botrbrau1/2256/Bobra.101_2s0080.1
MVNHDDERKKMQERQHPRKYALRNLHKRMGYITKCAPARLYKPCHVSRLSKTAAWGPQSATGLMGPGAV